ncbi:mitochondrial mRNA pseudouridine synthase Trub2 isoform X2 [Octopus sinensis]|uniref:Mitochondrial mRNA pseudouridine synthase Trub2 isoform X2 n=1 Tax=Octopus sinensis TaxID=2607531 RepID=A0A7E6EH08_9MOLL|nr:mitochondrial mRNA pseudouridine synthase Trub2 isoform X2 [Octopus sinensis]
MKLDWAPSVYRRLHGVFCVYKPENVTMQRLFDTLKFNISNALNELPCYKHEMRTQEISFETGSTLPATVTKPVGLTDLTDHRLVIGIQKGINTINTLKSCQFLRVYHVKGQFGKVTEDFSARGRLLQKISYYHIKRSMLDKVCAAAQAQHQRQMFIYAKVDLQSQEAYEIASKGLVRPAQEYTPTILYGIKCIDFQPPDFTLEIHTLQEKTTYLMSLIHNIGLQLKSGAICTQIRCIRNGHFTLEHALLRKFWTVPDILENISICRKLTTPDKLITPSLLVDPTTEENNNSYLPEPDAVKT